MQCLEKGLFTWMAVSLEKQKSLLMKTRDLKISYGIGRHLPSASSVVFLCFALKIVWNFPFLMSLLNFFFLYVCYLLPRFYQICLLSSSYKYPLSWSCKLTESNQFKVDIKYKTGLSWSGDTWLTNLQKTFYATSFSPNQSAKFSWKLTLARWILRQRNINAITTYFKYLIRDFNSLSDLVPDPPVSFSLSQVAPTFLMAKAIFPETFLEIILHNAEGRWRIRLYRKYILFYFILFY